MTCLTYDKKQTFLLNYFNNNKFRIYIKKSVFKFHSKIQNWIIKLQIYKCFRPMTEFFQCYK